MPSKLTLHFDNRLMEGLTGSIACSMKWLQLPNGVSRLRRRSDGTAKKLLEELFPKLCRCFFVFVGFEVRTTSQVITSMLRSLGSRLLWGTGPPNNRWSVSF